MQPWRLRLLAVVISCYQIFSPLVASADLREAAAYSAAHHGVSMVVLVDGRPFFEDYPNGHAANEGHELASGTKSFSGIIAAAAVQDGLLKLDEPVALTIQEWRRDPIKSTITIRQLLGLVSGIDGSAGKRIGRMTSFSEIAAKAKLTARPGEKFSYGQDPFQLFGEIMHRKLAKVSGETPIEYLDRRIFTPLHIQPVSWKKDKQGMPHMPSGAFLTARDWAVFGEFIRQQGKWQGRQLVDVNAFWEMFKSTPANPCYGLTWWLDKTISPLLRSTIPPLTNSTDLCDRPYAKNSAIPEGVVLAAGLGGQRLYIIPAKRMVIARQADCCVSAILHADKTGFSDRQFLELALRYSR
ncbi:MAG: serine hydrolase domain-containing protein [Alphaproteobacteria bacterium]